MKRQRNNKLWDALTFDYPEFKLEVGWFEESKYSDGTPIGGIAAVQNYGAVINQNVTAKQRAYFHYIDIHLKKETNTLHIVIPPTHFMENCVAKNKAKWQKLCHDAWTSVLLGNITHDKAMEQIGMAIEGDVAKEIANGNYPPDKDSTVKAKMNRYADKKTRGDLDKRLVDTGQMLNALSHKVTEL